MWFSVAKFAPPRSVLHPQKVPNNFLLLLLVLGIILSTDKTNNNYQCFPMFEDFHGRIVAK